MVKDKVKVAEKAKVEPSDSMDTIALLQGQLNQTQQISDWIQFDILLKFHLFFNAAHARNECRLLLEPKKIKHFLPLLSVQG